MNTREDILSRVDKRPDGCWIWLKAKNAMGYGVVSYENRVYLAHRLFYSWLKKPIPQELHACHTCDVPGCCNPDHIFVGTDKDNVSDKMAKKRHQKSFATACIHGHEYTPENVRFQVRKSGKTQRRCVECSRIASRKRRALARGRR